MNTPILGKVALITGAGFGNVNADGALEGHAPSMGVAIAQKLANMGAVVIATDIIEEAAQKTISTLVSYPENPAHMALKLDVTKADDIKAALEKIHETYGALDIVCNNAGVSSMAEIEDITEKDWDFNVDINMKGVFLCTQAVVPYMKEKGGRIVNT